MSASPRRRWYENNPQVGDAMRTWELFPRHMQCEVAQEIRTVIKARHPHIRLTGIVTGFSMKRVMIAWKRMRKARWYDHDGLLRSTIHTLRFIDHGDLIDIAQHIIDLGTYVRQQELRLETLSRRELRNIVRYVFSNRNIRLY